MTGMMHEFLLFMTHNTRGPKLNSSAENRKILRSSALISVCSSHMQEVKQYNLRQIFEPNHAENGEPVVTNCKPQNTLKHFLSKNT